LLIYFQKVFTLGPTHFLVFFAWILRFWLKPLPVNYEIKKMAIQTKHENNISGLFWFHTFEKSNLTFLSFVQLLLPFSQSFFSFLFFSLKSTLFFILSLPLYFRSLFIVNQISSFALLIFLDLTSSNLVRTLVKAGIRISVFSNLNHFFWLQQRKEESKPRRIFCCCCSLIFFHKNVNLDFKCLHLAEVGGRSKS